MADVEMPRAHEPMAPNETVGNTSPKKRKVEEDGDEKPRKIASPALTKKPRQDGDASVSPLRAPSSSAGSSAPLIQLKGRKLVLKQDAFKLTPPSRLVLKFETFLLDAEEEGKKVTEVPEDYWGLIAMLGHESTVRTEAALVKQTKTALTARVGRDNDTLAADALTPLISKLFSQKDYGFLVSDFLPSSSTTKLPAALQLRYWEVNEPEKYFLGDQLGIVISRVEERRRARAECLRLLEDMDDIEKLELLKGDKEKGEKEKKPAKGESDKKGKVAVNGAEPIVVDGNDEAGPSSWPSESPAGLSRSVREGTGNTVDSTRSARSVSPAKKAKMTPEEAEAARLRKEEREAKKLERAEKKAEADRIAEKAKQNLAKQQQVFSMFIKKPAAPIASPARPVAGPSVTNASPSRPTQSDYEKTFKAVQKRPNVEWAPINRFREGARAKPAGQAGSSSEQTWTAKDYLRDHLKTYGHTFAPPPRASLPSSLKSAPLFGTVADVWQTLEDAEEPRKVLAILKDRKRFPWKVLAFDEDVRPPYCGTYAKKSIAVGGRTPFAQDPALDYGYDSAEDWVDDEGGEDVDDFGEAPAGSGDEEDEGEGEEEDEFDDWLDDSEDVGFTRPEDGSSEGSPEPAPLAEQSKLPQQVVKSRPVPKKLVKLKPFFRGPMWEETIGEGSSGMQEYRLQLLNDTPDTIDPFKYTSSDPVQAFKTNFSSTVIGTNLAVRCLLSADPIISRPPVPPFDAQPIPTSSAPESATEPKAVSSRSTPKVAFPDTHLADLLQSIEGSTKIRTDLVSQLREKFEGVASKVAIDAKLREVAVRVGKTKDSQWKVHPEAWVAAGIPVPQPSSSRESQKTALLPLPLPGQTPFLKDEYTVEPLPIPPQQMAVDSSSF